MQTSSTSKTDNSLSFDPSTSSNLDRFPWHGDRCGSMCQEDTLVLNQRLVSSTLSSTKSTAKITEPGN